MKNEQHFSYAEEVDTEEFWFTLKEVNVSKKWYEDSHSNLCSEMRFFIIKRNGLTELNKPVHCLTAGSSWGVEFSPLATNANLTFARYVRNFAGQSRSTRDLGLLAEMIEDLKAIAAQMAKVAAKALNKTFQADIDIVNANMKMYRDELTEIEKAQKQGYSKPEQF